ncbi:MAG: glycosyltransferase family 4 protein [Verrucomicrobiae bacterium]|nr:glycosyltransferase family 4 protein [Verrucomicrobiae bacterium]
MDPAPPAVPSPIRPLILHGETLGCAGAQRVLAFFLNGTCPDAVEPTLALAPNPKLSPLIPALTPTHPLPSNQQFSPVGLARQLLSLRRLIRSSRCHLLHGWTARDWELTALASRLFRLPSIGSLHEHPRAQHINPRRQHLMRACARHGLHRVLCVSDAVAAACRSVGYPAERLLVVRNGIPARPTPSPPAPGPVIRLGYLGILDDSKGLPDLFQLLDLAAPHSPPWSLQLAGGTLDAAGEACVAQIRNTYRSRPWWPAVSWLGWVQPVNPFLQSIDLLLMPSTAFDAFPTVLLEAGEAARPAFAHRIGGVPEIVQDDNSGWLYDRTDLPAAARLLTRLLHHPGLLTRAGTAAAARIRTEFAVDRMVAQYASAYRTLSHPAR